MKADLLLEIESDPYGVECPKHALLGCAIQNNQLCCRSCRHDKGWSLETGTRTVRLVGMVGFIIIRGDKVYLFAAKGWSPMFDTPEKLANKIIEYYKKDGKTIYDSLPDEIRDCLKEVPA